MIKKITALLIGYIALFFLVQLFTRVVFPIDGTISQNLEKEDALRILPLFLSSLVLTFSIFIYLFNSMLGKKWIRFNWSAVILFMGVTAALGPVCEVLINTATKTLFGQGLWVYKLLPVHGGDTSLVMSIIWPLYGFHVYCFHKALLARRDKNEDKDLAIFIGVDAITLEVLVNLFSLSFFNTYIFYYFAPDLHHLSTALIFIPYILIGFVAIKLLHFLEKTPHHLIIGIAGFIINWIVIFIV